MTSQPIPFHLTLSVPSTSAVFDINSLLPKNFVAETWTSHTDYADISTIGSWTTQKLAIETRVEIMGYISPYWPNG